MATRFSRGIGRTGRAVLALLVVFGAACGKRRESSGEISQNWRPQPGTQIQSVPVDQVKAAIVEALKGKPPAGVNSDRWHHVRSLYGDFAGSPLWLHQDGNDHDRTRALLAALEDGQNDALTFKDIPLDSLRQSLATLKSSTPTAAQLAQADVLLTTAYVSLGEDLLTGQLDPHQMSQDWHINPREEHVDSALVQSLRSDSLPAALDAMRPQNAGYQALRDALVRYRNIVAHGGWPTVPHGRALKVGQSDTPARIRALRDRMRAEGYLNDSGTASDSTTSGSASRSGAVYDRSLAGAVAQFQAAHGIVVDSVLGSETVASLDVPADYRLGQIAANLERYRWLPRRLGDRYILVNVPSFRLQAYDSGSVALDMKVIVGAEYENRKTPVFSDSMEYVIFRPYWLVPDSIAAKEIWPKVQQDPTYLDRNNYEVYSDHGKQRVRQRPGDKNSLGLVKFMFPNDFNIYLHDTPQGELFQKDVRAFSHGCIRLEKPADLATWVLGWPMDRVQQAMHDGADDHTVYLKRKIPVYIVYFTAYARDDQLYFGNDLYNRDDALVQAVARGAQPDAAALQALGALKGA